MQKLVIYLTQEIRIRQCEAETNPITLIPTWETAEEYGRRWAKFYRSDIVMIVEE